jgi:drug/metabolite transporter (DMT)-like permease
MTRLLVTGVLAALFFSSTFVLNRAMSLEGGHWVWTASLRYAFTLLILVLGFVGSGRGRILRAVWRTYRDHWLFWTVAGSVGFGIFYSGVSYASAYAPGWVIATTWQTTILATAVVLALFGRNVPLRGVAFTLLIFAGIVLVNVESAANSPVQDILRGVAPVLIAAFAYPLGMQMVWEARTAGTGRLATGAPSRFARWMPAIREEVVDQPFARVLLLVLGSLPFWIVLVAVMQPPPPAQGQLVNTFLVALLSGVVATVLFMQARHWAHTSYELAAVDSTQSTEVIWSLLGEVLLLGAALPGIWGVAGVCMTLVGLVLFLFAQEKSQK